MRIAALICAWLGGVLAAGAGLLALYVLVCWVRLPDPSATAEQGDPGPTAFMAEDGCDVHDRRYRPLNEIDPRLVCMVVWAEDWQFFHHDGVDRQALRRAFERNWRARRYEVGASTITMQLARNLYLSRARTPSRKGKEIALALEIEEVHDKRRVLELYLSSAEFAPCTYGVEAASHRYLGHGAGQVDLAEAAFLASLLPRPTDNPGATERDRDYLVRQQARLLRRLAYAGLFGKDEFLAAQRRILDNAGDGWASLRPMPRTAAWDRALERACGARPARETSKKE